MCSHGIKPMTLGWCQLSWMPMTWIWFQKNWRWMICNHLFYVILLYTLFFQFKKQKLRPLLRAFRYVTHVYVPPILHPPMLSWVISGGVYDSAIKHPEPTGIMRAVHPRTTKAAQMSLFKKPITRVLQALINRCYALFTQSEVISIAPLFLTLQIKDCLGRSLKKRC